jgi:hypothetical protein
VKAGTVATAALVLVAGVPLSLIATILLHPLWGWVESRWGVEAVGHSGPAGWCYLLTYAVLAASGLLAVGLGRRALPGRP